MTQQTQTIETKRKPGRPKKLKPNTYTTAYADTNLRDPDELVYESIDAIEPPKRIKVSESAQTMRIATAQGSSLYDLNTAPYMQEPMDCLTNRDYESVIFVGPQRSSKSLSLIDAFIHHSVLFDPADMLVIFPTQAMARDYSIRRLDKLIDVNDSMKNRIRSASADNVFDKTFTSGGMVTLGYAAVSQLRQRDAQYGICTELDSITDPQDIEGAGDLFGLLKKRSETFLSSGRTVIESAPARPVNLQAMAEFEKTTDHDCYPSDGIALLYMQGDRRRLYWECLNPECKQDMEASMKNLHWDDLPSITDSANSVRFICPTCGHVHKPEDKFTLNLNLRSGRGGWRKAIDYETGKDLVSKSVSFWQEGVASAFNDWPSIVESELKALKYYYETGDSTTLKQTRNSDQGLQFLSPDWESSQLTAQMMNRAEDLPERIVPDDVYFLMTTIDQQKRRFVVQVEGFGVGGESWIIDRYNITQSPTRVADDGKPCGIEPASYAEDWDALFKVTDRTYKTVSGADMGSVRVLYDTGGLHSDGATATQNAYAFYRRWLKTATDKAQLVPVKGDERGERIRLSTTVLKAQGIPLYILNVNQLKDEVDFALKRETPGPSYKHMPKWLPEWFYKELQAEHKDPRTGKWKKRKSNAKNESFDLMTYAKAGFSLVKGEHIDWNNPPDFAIKASERLQIQQVQKQTEELDSFISNISALAGSVETVSLGSTSSNRSSFSSRRFR